MSEIPTSLDFGQFSYVPFPDSSDFGQFFLYEIRTLKNPNGTKSLNFRQEKKCLKSERLCLDFGHFFIYIPQITYCPLHIQ